VITLGSLRLRNFGPYLGDQTVDLSTPHGSSVVMVHGENTLGKTQLFAGLRWCLYGSFEPEQTHAGVSRSLDARFNRIALREGERELEVQVAFEAGDSYVLTRRARKLDNRVDVSADLRIGATVVPAATIDAEIGRLLHPQISEFFLFDAELLERFYDRLNSERERAFIRDSIDRVLGIPALQLATRDVGDLGADASRRVARAAKGREEADTLRARLQRLASERVEIEGDLHAAQEGVKQAEATREELREQMAAVHGLEGDAREQQMLEANLADGIRDEAKLRTELKDLLSSGWLAGAVAPLTRALEETRIANTAAQRDHDAVEAMRRRVALLEDRVRGGACPTCGQALLPPEDGTLAELESSRSELRSLLEASAGGEVDLERERRLASLVDGHTADAYRDKYERLNRLQMLQYERQQALASIVDRLKGHEAADIRALGQRLGVVERAIEQARGQASAWTNRLTGIASDEQVVMRRLSRLPGAEPAVG
jgi:DNA sulfur modification protein DndD